MPTAVEQRYHAAIDYIDRAIKAAHPLTLNPIELYAGSKKVEPVENERDHIEARWLRATTDRDREQIARDAELLADRTQESLPGAPQDRARTNLSRGEKPAHAAATTYAGEVQHQVIDYAHDAEHAIDWIDGRARDLVGEVGDLGKWALIGGGLLLGWHFLGARPPAPELPPTRDVDTDTPPWIWLGLGGAALAYLFVRQNSLAGDASTFAPGHSNTASDAAGAVVTDEAEALARVVTSEADRYSEKERTAIAWTVRNRAKKRAVSIARLVCHPTCGPCCHGRPFSSARAATAENLALARRVIAAPQSEDPTGGALSFFEPLVQDKLVAGKRPGYRFTSAELRDRWKADGQTQLSAVGKFEFWA